MTIKDYFGDWGRVLDIKEAGRVMEYLKTQKAVCPLLKNVFKAFKLCPFHNLQVVILGQDPYFTLKDGKPIATGIAFGNDKDTLEKNFSPSLDVIRESVIDFSIQHRVINFDASLEKWEEQGVLMLNTALSCIAGKPGSHTLLWRLFIKSLLTNLSQTTPGIVYVLMGESARSMESYINPGCNFIIKTNHPSYYARTKTTMPHSLWREINTILIGQSGKGIKWYEETD